MIKYNNTERQNEIDKHFKIRVFKLRKMSGLIFLFVIFQLQIVLSAQIKIAIDNPSQTEKPWWWEYKDIIFAPYDSSYTMVKDYPTIDAYDKYIGQSLYLPSIYIDGCGYRGDAERLLIGTDNIPIENSYMKEHYLNKYFTIIDVLCIKDAEFELHCGPVKRSGSIEGRSFTNTENTTPYFILKETQSGDTVYAPYKNSFILVGGFEKIQQSFIGQNIFELTDEPSRYNFHQNIIKDKWVCSDVSLRVPPDGTYSNDVIVYLNLNNIDDNSIKKEIRPNQVDDIDNRYQNHDTGVVSYIERYRSGEYLQTTLTKIAAEEKLREVENEEYKRILAQKKASYKRNLASKYSPAIAEKIIAGKYEIGMSKSVCKEIAGYATVIDKTENTEIWKIASFFGNSTYLYFGNGELVRIVKY